ncbi:hypothetical protein SHELI_v1c01690 [Spiroplasma helicoides]|uniref:DUF402 domain-containing protein n=1 Tax=Spiroplasma helicoides TaxID=216938 RepID=A0A1B3SJL7_9MOLU|nr:DUF402 domain-containing protein [Spiroplasma helicoides]AOG60124.1 hypothetical protein SHELI_v1c01690 [Spiroplasma helicoides]
MNSVKPFDKVLVHAYKQNGSLYRSWEKAIVFKEDEEVLILINEDVVITEFNGRKWRTNEPAIWFFFKKEWYNIICMFKEQGINYYCNIASPYIFESKTIKYIDYDLDIKVFNDGSYKILDLKEFNRNRISYSYSRTVIEKVWESVDKLKEKLKKPTKYFLHEFAQDLWEEYKKMKTK